MWQHSRLHHNSAIRDFTMSVTGLYRNNCTLRQVKEPLSQEKVSVATLIST